MTQEPRKPMVLSDGEVNRICTDDNNPWNKARKIFRDAAREMVTKGGTESQRLQLRAVLDIVHAVLEGDPNDPTTPRRYADEIFADAERSIREAKGSRLSPIPENAALMAAKRARAV